MAAKMRDPGQCWEGRGRPRSLTAAPVRFWFSSWFPGGGSSRWGFPPQFAEDCAREAQRWAPRSGQIREDPTTISKDISSIRSEQTSRQAEEAAMASQTEESITGVTDVAGAIEHLRNSYHYIWFIRGDYCRVLGL